MDWVVAIPLLPAAAFAILAPMSRRMRARAKWVSVVAMAGSFLLSVLAFARLWPGGGTGHEVAYHVFLPIAPTSAFGVGFLVDPVSAVMIIVVTVVGLCVQVYSLGYMHRDERIGWYYAVLSLFSAAMLAVVLADNFLMLYMAWEVMGLCSYLLIGFWHTEEAPRQASLKAFLVTRVGDIGFVIGLAVMYSVTGSFSYTAVLPAAASWAPGVATAVALLLLFGAMGKSAQFPLHVWLPDAMAGPTPASALIHAATMVAAGVYLVFRSLPIFTASEVALAVTLAIGTITALLGGSLAIVQNDVKKVLAYSTISQLGFMFIALGAGGDVAALFHLTTHAFFKSLLFLGAGVIIHACRTQDMREMGGLARKLPFTTTVFTIGALALAGVFPLSGFFSKDEILAVLWHEGHRTVFVLALIAAMMTAFYVTRMWVMVFLGKPKTDLTEGHASMLAPMGVLAAITVAISFASPALTRFIGGGGELPELGMALLSTAVGLTGILAGYLIYARRVIDPDRLRERLGVVYGVLEQRYYLDWLYQRLFVRPYIAAASALARFDSIVIDGAVNGAAAAWRRTTVAADRFDVAVIDATVNRAADEVVASGERLRRVQTGRVQTYQKLILGALVLLMLWIVLKGA